ncbi:hypothetical protein ABEB36_011605 [Hypothenemus hampei]|uniref:Uncharacterized protein n=1 Tax=Hypothenemus hampei TaxID=57062 RepID=A0ABD1E9A3_HYPHA
MPKKDSKTQQIIIPKGTIDPNEDTLIEIPGDMQEQPVVIVERSRKSFKSIESNQEISVKTSNKSKDKVSDKDQSIGYNGSYEEYCRKLKQASTPSKLQSSSTDRKRKTEQSYSAHSSTMTDSISSDEDLPLNSSSKRNTIDYGGWKNHDSFSQTFLIAGKDSAKKPKENCSKYCMAKLSLDDVERDRRTKRTDDLKKFYKRSDDHNSEIDEMYSELKRQFAEAKKKLDEAVKLAKLSLPYLNQNNQYSPACKNSTTLTPQASMIDDNIPERDIAVITAYKRFQSQLTKNSSKTNDMPKEHFNLNSSSVKLDSFSKSKPLNDSKISRKITDLNHSHMKSDSQLGAVEKPPYSYRKNEYEISHLKHKRSNLDFQSNNETHSQLFLNTSSSTKCLAGCVPKRSSSIKFVKEPCCNISTS